MSSAKTAALLAFHRGGNAASRFGTLKPDGTGLTINPYNASMEVANSFFTRLDAAGDRMTWAQKRHVASIQYFADSVAADGSAPQEIYRSDPLSTMDARDVTFGDPAGASLLYTDVGTNYQIDGSEVCDARDSYTDVLVLRTPVARGSGAAPDPTAVFCADNTILSAPALSSDGSTIAAEADSTAGGSSGRIVTIPMSGAVGSASAQSPLKSLTAEDSGDTLPDFSPDGTQIAFQGPGGTIYTLPASGGTARLVLSKAAVPAWSPYTLPSTEPAVPPVHKRHQCVVPRLSGLTVGRARTALKHAGCRLGRRRAAYSRRVGRGRVISQSRRPKAVLPAGAKIGIVVSRGKKPRGRHH